VGGRRWAVVLVAALVVAGMGLRIAAALRPGLWADEIFSLAMATGHSLEHPAAVADPARGDFVEGATPRTPDEWLRYVEHDRKRRPSTVEDYRNVVRNDLLPEFGETPLEEITLEWIDGYRARLVAEGRSNKEVARALGVTPETVKTHLKHLFDKLSVERRAQAVARARSLGLL